jgi:hypothetical protein
MPDLRVLVVNEAMGCGRAVIATTAVGSAYSMIKSGTNLCRSRVFYIFFVLNRDL